LRTSLLHDDVDMVAASFRQPGGVGFEFDRLGVRVHTAGDGSKDNFRSHERAEYGGELLRTSAVETGQAPSELADVSEALALTAARQDPSIPVPAATQIEVTRRAAALGKALAHANAKPVSDLQNKILLGAAKRLGLSPAQQEAVEATETAHAQPLKFEA
jgi:hypothetical protein